MIYISKGFFATFLTFDAGVVLDAWGCCIDKAPIQDAGTVIMLASCIVMAIILRVRKQELTRIT